LIAKKYLPENLLASTIKTIFKEYADNEKDADFSCYNDNFAVA